MTITETVYTTLAKYHELTTNGVYKHCADQPGINELKTVRNAFDRLKSQGKAISYCDDERGIFFWKAVKDDDDTADAASKPADMTYDIAEIETATTSNVVNHDAECRDKPRKQSRPYTPNKIAGAYSYRRALVITPESRNELLASKFRLYRICEERGTGFQKVVSAVELYGMPPVVFSPMENAFQITLYAPRKFSAMSQAERIEACYQHAVLQYFSSQTLTNTTLRTRFKVSERHRNQITNLIGDAVTAERIKRKDSTTGNKFAEYVPYWA